ncbi:hypothetical protein [Gordonia polyisoprenivorans]|uniref:hypothetical protein n=1 Tax=Gordonia polyisoprenivorans TaxID=84595 RepID=UPI001AD6BC7B|nr:hypothetical protein [Gordonia polyisoprenivorans]QTI71399.1 hypothetical protein J6U32_13340 [Gordonia polyisoprenivorans]
MIADWLGAIMQAIQPPTPPANPQGPNGTPSDDQVREQFEEVLQEIADAAAAAGAFLDPHSLLSPQQFGTDVHTIFEDFVKKYLGPQLALWFGPDFITNLEKSIDRTVGITRGQDGRFVWDPRGQSGTARPDLVITRLVVNAAGDVVEEIFQIIDLKTGNADIGKSWRNDLSRVLGITHDMIQSVKPNIPRPPKTTPPSPPATTP